MKNLTFRYSLTQFTFWAAASGAASFAATFLLACGLSTGVVGTILALAGLLACLTQPVLAGIADRAQRFVLLRMLLVMSALCAVCCCIQLLPQLSPLASGLSYMLALWLSDAMVPLLNALSVSCEQAGYRIDYGAARGVGAAATALSALVLGWVIARVGSGWMLLLLALLRMLCICSLLCFPRLQKAKESGAAQHRGVTIGGFLSCYRRYCLTLAGILFLGMYHAMTESYLIAIVEPLGGNSSHVGTALFISAIVSAPVIFFFARLQRVLTDSGILKIAACSFLLKAVLFCFAKSIAAIYLFQLLQITSYALLAPVQVSYGRASVREADMVKGQAFSTAAYALGCAAGNFAGGQLLRLGVRALLAAGIGMALAGTVIIFLTADKKDHVCGMTE